MGHGQGYLDQALACAARGLELAARLGHPNSLALVQGVSMWPHFHRRELRQAHERLDAAAATNAAHGLGAMASFLVGWRALLRIAEGDPASGLELCDRALALNRASGTRHELALQLLGLAAAHHALDQDEQALAALAEAREAMVSCGERLWQPELDLLRAEVLLETAGASAAEAAMLHGLEAARRQQARTLELQAAVALARLWQGQGRRAEARGVLAPVYGWFTEGLDTAPLVTARDLLADLG